MGTPFYPRTRGERRLILAGGGHAQLSVLHALAAQPPEFEVVLVTPSPYQIYSGMLPGWMGGHYSLSDCQIDLRPLAKAAGATLLMEQIVGLEASGRTVFLSNGTPLAYDLLSLDIGAESDLSWLEAAQEHLLPIKPLGEFVRRWPSVLAAAVKQEDYRLVVVGGGAAGVELAFAAQQACAGFGCKPSITLVFAQNSLLPGHSRGTQRRAEALLGQRGITLVQERAAGIAEGLMLSSGQFLRADCILATTGSRAPAWLRDSGLELDEQGYVGVDATHRSRSHGEVFAAGDVCSRTDIRLARSGVHAVFAGPVLAHNLLASIRGEPLITYQPHHRSLYLLATGPKQAIASWGGLSAHGHWVWLWKNWIDRRFMNKHAMGTDHRV